ncbi:MAG TPA: hypothetical protein PLG90_02790 [Ignavibacteria bacterium]|nr:hypothetical protein [Ignavibacteria bacterium]
MILITVTLIGCSKNPVTSEIENGNGNGSGSGSETSGIKLNVISSDETDNPAGDLQISEAKALLSKIEVENSSGSREINMNSLVVNFNLSGEVKQIIEKSIPEGVYTKIKFQLHKPEDFETVSDPEFKTGNSGNQRFSVIIKGSYNGSAFVYKSRKSINIVLNFNQPIDIRNNMKNITLLLQKNLWFMSNGITLNPNDDDNKDIIDDNIKRSFAKAFKDDDKNGRPDDN